MALLHEIDGQLVPQAAAAGFWGPTTLAGQVVTGVLGRSAELDLPDDSWRLGRLTVDMVKMTTLDPFTISTTRVHVGRRLLVTDVALEQRGRVTARARATAVPRDGAATVGAVWSASSTMPPPPAPRDRDTAGAVFAGLLAYSGDDAAGTPDPTRWSSGEEPKYVWWHLDHELVLGESMSPTTRAAFLADTTNPLTGWGSAGLEAINADCTLTLTREPEGTVLGLEARDLVAGPGVSTGSAVVHDVRGPVGLVSVLSLLASGS